VQDLVSLSYPRLSNETECRNIIKIPEMSRLLNRGHSFKGRVKVPITRIISFALDSIHKNTETVLNWEDR